MPCDYATHLQHDPKGRWPETGSDAGAVGYNGPFYNEGGVQIGTFSNSVARIDSNTVITQVTCLCLLLKLICSPRQCSPQLLVVTAEAFPLPASPFADLTAFESVSMVWL